MPKRPDVRAVGEFAASRHGVFSWSQAAAHQMSRGDIASLMRCGVITRIRRGIRRFTSSPTGWRQDAYAATLEVRAVASFFTAAALLKVDGLTAAPQRTELLCHHAAPVAIDGALIRRTRFLSKRDVTVVDGIPCTNLARTACDLAPLITNDQLIRMIDDMQRRGVSMRWVMQRAMVLRRRGRSGPAEVLDIVRRRIDGYRVPDSWFERLLEACLQSPILGGLVRQHTLRDGRGHFVARFDLALPWVRLGIEGHSRSYHLGEHAEQYDEDRDIRATQQGWEIAYLGFAATRSPWAVCRDVELIVLRRAADLGLDLPNAAQTRLSI